jgi:hypothetical protein
MLRGQQAVAAPGDACAEHAGCASSNGGSVSRSLSVQPLLRSRSGRPLLG